jgi:hypothetical protein
MKAIALTLLMMIKTKEEIVKIRYKTNKYRRNVNKKLMSLDLMSLSARRSLMSH